MIRTLVVTTNKHIREVKAGVDMTRGAAAVIDYATEEAKLASVGECFMVDVNKTYNGINAVVEPSDGAFEAIKAGQKVLLIPVLPGERYATTEVDGANSLEIGADLKPENGKFKAGEGGWVYMGKYNDPTGLDMYIVERKA